MIYDYSTVTQPISMCLCLFQTFYKEHEEIEEEIQKTVQTNMLTIYLISYVHLSTL